VEEADIQAHCEIQASWWQAEVALKKYNCTSDAIVGALNSLYGKLGKEASCYELGGLYGDASLIGLRTGMALMDDGVDYSEVEPLHSIRVFSSSKQAEHWHYITLGFSDLYFAGSGPGNCDFELTMRVEKGKDVTPPYWPIHRLQQLARYVVETGNTFLENEHIDFNGSILQQPGVSIEAIICVVDPELGVIHSDCGDVKMFQLVGLTREELGSLSKWQAAPFIQLLARKNPLMLTNLHRASILEDPEINNIVKAGIINDHSSTNAFYTDYLRPARSNNGIELKLKAMNAEKILVAMEKRLPFGMQFRLYGQGDFKVDFMPANQSNVRYVEDKSLLIELSQETVREIRTTLRPMQGKYSFATLPGLNLQLVSNDIDVN